MNVLPKRLQEIIEDFSYCEGIEKLEYLLQFSENLTPLPERLRIMGSKVRKVNCSVEIYIYREIQNGKIFLYFDVPADAPTIAGYICILQEGLAWLSLEQINEIPNEFFYEMGLQHVVSKERIRDYISIFETIKF